jgi:hypothetical protein
VTACNLSLVVTVCVGSPLSFLQAPTVFDGLVPMQKNIILQRFSTPQVKCY